MEILAERFTFTPSSIEVPVGVTLELRIRSADTMHGFRIVGHDVNVAVPKRRQGEAVVVFEAIAGGGTHLNARGCAEPVTTSCAVRFSSSSRRDGRRA